jgi:hypothetical protein
MEDAIEDDRNEDGKENIGHIAFCVLRSLFGTRAELAIRPLSQECRLASGLAET